MITNLASPLDIRQRLAADPHRPAYHFQPPHYWMNDPNGFIHWRGQYHLFYQHNPNSALHTDMHWGHAVSSDLVHWRDLPIALAPTPGSPDKDGCWSGCAVDNDGVPTLVYTGVHPQCQCLAVGSADLLTWRKHERNPVIAAPPPEFEVTGFRDPCVWREGDTWYAVIGSGIQGVGGTVLLYRSPDLVNWQYLHPLLVGDQRDTGIMWECPSFFPLGDKHILIISVVPLAYVEYFVGTYRDLKFEPEFHSRLDYSGLFYAPQTILDNTGRRLMFGWLREARDTRYAVQAEWSGMQSVPRLLTMRPDHRLGVTAAPELQTLRGQHYQVVDQVVNHLSTNMLAEAPGLSSPVKGRNLEILAEIDPGSAPRFGLRIFASPDGTEQTLIVYDRATHMLTVDRSRSCADPAGVDIAPELAALPLETGEMLKLHIFLDGSTVEIFANGHTCLTTRVYPTRPDSVGVELFAWSGDITIKRLDIWQLRSIW